MSQLLAVEGISKGFPGVQALDGVNFELDRGEVLALVGENGAGKSTLMKILSGIYTMDSGRIVIDGDEVDVNDPKAAQKLGISIIHQEMNLMPHLTVAQNIYIGREPRTGFWLREGELNRRTQRLLDDLGILLEPTQVVGDLTVASQQMVEIAKALSFDSTKILIMDEPTSAISISETQVLFRLIRSLRDRGVGIVYISHRMEELRQIADRVTVLRDGQYVGTRRMDEVTDDEIIAMMVGREISAAYLSRQEAPANTAEVALEVRGLSTRTCCATSPSRCAGARSSGSPASWARGAPRPPGRSSAPTRWPRARSRSRASRSGSRAPRSPSGTGSATCRRTASGTG
jgi:ribose transport system ATP-binding protein